MSLQRAKFSNAPIPMSPKVKAKVLIMTCKTLHHQSAWPYLYLSLSPLFTQLQKHCLLLPFMYQTRSHLRAFALAAPSVQNNLVFRLSGLNLNTSKRTSLTSTSKPSPKVDWQDGGMVFLHTVPRLYLMFCHRVAVWSETRDLLCCQRRKKGAWSWHTGSYIPGHINGTYPFHQLQLVNFI